MLLYEIIREVELRKERGHSIEGALRDEVLRELIQYRDEPTPKYIFLNYARTFGRTPEAAEAEFRHLRKEDPRPFENIAAAIRKIADAQKN